MGITLGSLFDGAGGFPYAGTLAGITPIWASEIEPFPIRVTTKRFPEMKHLGNIAEVSGAEIEPVDIITFGSPCQDLSVAGNRAGLAGERSGLFREAVRIIREMREKTNGNKPKYIVWENVPGAFSSNGGDDFRTVLEEIARIKDGGVIIPQPDKGKWSGSGEILGNGYSIAWRTYDAQYWGVPQRRKRIYLVADLNSQCAGKVQFESDRLCRDSPQGKGEGQAAPGTAGGNTETPGGGSVAFHLTQDPIASEERTTCISTGNPRNGQATIGVAVPKATVYGLSSKASNAWKSNNPHSGCYEAETTRTLDTRGGDPTCAQGGNIIVQARVFENHGQDTRFRDTGEVCQTVTQKYGTGGGNTPLVVQPAYTIGRDYLTTWEEKAQTLTRSDVPGMVAQPAYGVTSKGNGDCFLTLERHTSLTAGGGQAGQGYPCVAQPYTIGNGQVHDLTLDEKARTMNCMHDAQAAIIPQTADEYPYIVRRLMPIECCRLQGYPDWWCDGLQTAEPTEEELDWWIGVFETHRKATKPDTKPRTRNQVRKWLQDPQTDSAEYRMWGNSLAIPNAYQVLAGIAEQIQAEESETLYIASWSGGKDSTASIILAHEHGEPLDLIIFSEVMFDKETSGELPDHINFIKNKAIPLFESWGYEVKVLHAELTYMDLFMRKPTRGKRKGLGLKTGFPMAMRCQVNRSAKIKPIEDFLKTLDKQYAQYVGIATDEPERLERAKGKGQISLLEKYGYTEQMAYDLCEKYGMLSPVYEFTNRGGCWFCPNARKPELKNLRNNHPDLWQRLLDLEDEPNLIGKIWNSLEKKSIHMMEERFRQEDAQMTIWDYLKQKEPTGI